MSRQDDENELLCRECGHPFSTHGLSKCYFETDTSECKCSNRLGGYLAAMHEDINWAECERDELQRKLNIAVEALRQAEIMTRNHDADTNFCLVQALKKLEAL